MANKINKSTINPVNNTICNSKSLIDPSYQNLDEQKESNNKLNLSKFDYELYHEEDNIVETVIRVKRITHSNNEEWKIFKNKEVILIIDGSKCSKKEREFIRSVDGVNWLIKLAKEISNLSFNKFKIELKKKFST